MSFNQVQFNFQIGGRINFQLIGEESQPKKLIFLHGLMGSWVNWRRIMNAFEKDFHMLAFDQRGHGQSFHPDVGYAPEDYASDLLKIVDTLGWEKFFLVGHSMGGRNALSFATANPERLHKLVVEDIGPEAKADSVAQYERLLNFIPTPFPNKRIAKEFFLNEFPRIDWQRDPKNVLAAFLMMNIVEKEDGSADWRFSRKGILESVKEGRGREHWNEWNGLQVETLLIRGANSKELTAVVYEQMLRNQPKAHGEVIANAGHWVHSDQPEKFIEVLRSFICSE